MFLKTVEIKRSWKKTEINSEFFYLQTAVSQMLPLEVPTVIVIFVINK